METLTTSHSTCACLQVSLQQGSECHAGFYLQVVTALNVLGPLAWLLLAVTTLAYRYVMVEHDPTLRAGTGLACLPQGH